MAPIVDGWALAHHRCTNTIYLPRVFLSKKLNGALWEACRYAHRGEFNCNRLTTILRMGRLRQLQPLECAQAGCAILAQRGQGPLGAMQSTQHLSAYTVHTFDPQKALPCLTEVSWCYRNPNPYYRNFHGKIASCLRKLWRYLQFQRSRPGCFDSRRLLQYSYNKLVPFDLLPS